MYISYIIYIFHICYMYIEICTYILYVDRNRYKYIDI